MPGGSDLLGTSLQVLGGSLQGVEGTGSFDDHLDAHVAPAALGGVTAGDQLDLLTVNGEPVITVGHIGVEGSQPGVVLQQVSGLLGGHGAGVDHGVEGLFGASDTSEPGDGGLGLGVTGVLAGVGGHGGGTIGQTWRKGHGGK